MNILHLLGKAKKKYYPETTSDLVHSKTSGFSSEDRLMALEDFAKDIGRWSNNVNLYTDFTTNNTDFIKETLADYDYIDPTYLNLIVCMGFVVINGTIKLKKTMDKNTLELAVIQPQRKCYQNTGASVSDRNGDYPAKLSIISYNDKVVLEKKSGAPNIPSGTELGYVNIVYPIDFNYRG